jgi:hypothetical protein
VLLLGCGTSGCASLLGDPFEDLKALPEAGREQSHDSGPDDVIPEPDAGLDAGPPPAAAKPPTPDPGPGLHPPAADGGTANPPQQLPVQQQPAPPQNADPFSVEPKIDDDAGAESPSYPPLDDCNPTFLASNGILYPRHSNGPRVFEAVPPEMRTKINTNHASPDCDPSDAEHCVIVASSIHIASGADVGVSGERPLVLLASGDITLDGVLNVAGGDGNQFQLEYGGPGDHTRGMSRSVSGGGGNSTQGGGSCDGTGAGPSIPLSAGLLGGGHGSQQPDELGMNCIAGGGGGGAVQIVSLCGEIRIRWYLNASGGGGRGGGQNWSGCPNGNGGGAGGTVWLQGRALSFGEASMFVQLSGGGGGGGSCQSSPDAELVPGNPGKGSTQIVSDWQVSGATCGSNIGGRGGSGGRREILPMRGGEATPLGMPALARCGGGGGARGRLVLQDLPNTCADVANATDGECVVAPASR